MIHPRLPIARGNGFKLLVGYLGFSAGILIMTSPAAAERLSEHLPLWVVVMWGIQLTMGCGLMMFGLLINRLLIERAGLILLLPASTVYAILLFLVLGPNQVFNGMPYLLFIYACWDRIQEINDILKAVTANG